MTHPSPLALAGALLATTVSVLAVAPAQAAARPVGYGDLDLTSEAGRAVMDKRIERAAGSVCAVDNRELAYIDACRRESVARARSDLGRVIGDRVRVASR